MGKLPFFAEHVAFDNKESFLLIPIKMGNSHKNGKIPKKILKFPFFAEHVAFDNRASFLQIPNKYVKIPIKMGKFL